MADAPRLAGIPNPQTRAAVSDRTRLAVASHRPTREMRQPGFWGFADSLTHSHPIPAAMLTVYAAAQGRHGSADTFKA